MSVKSLIVTGVNMNIDTDKRELIDRRDAIEAVTDYIFFDVYGGMKPLEKCETEAKSILCEIPTVESKRNNGEWIIHENADIVGGYYVPKYECPYCHTFNDDDYNFCTECGSDMRK